MTLVAGPGWLFCPADRPERFEKAAAAADVVILDLEDGVAAKDRPAARQALVDSPLDPARTVVRLNPSNTADHQRDLEALERTAYTTVMLAKTESGADIAATAARLPAGMPVIALVESAVGVEAVSDIARTPGCARIAFGLGDFRRDTGMSDDPAVLAYPRARLVIASRAAGLPAPIDGPTLRNQSRHLARETAVAKAAGMTGRLCLDAEHAETINRLLSPSATEIEEARTTLAHLDAPTGPYDGSVGPTRARALAVLDLAAKLGLH